MHLNLELKGWEEEDVGGNSVFCMAMLYWYFGPRTTWANEMNFGMNHTPGAGFYHLTC